MQVTVFGLLSLGFLFLVKLGIVLRSLIFLIIIKCLLLPRTRRIQMRLHQATLRSTFILSFPLIHRSQREKTIFECSNLRFLFLNLVYSSSRQCANKVNDAGILRDMSLVRGRVESFVEQCALVVSVGIE